MPSVDEIRSIFEAHDVDKNKKLDFNEATRAFKALGSHAAKINFEEQFNRLARDGTIDFDDFKTFSNIS